MKRINWTKPASLLQSLALLAGGTLLIVFSSVSAQTLTYAAGALLAAAGLLQILLFFLPTKANRFAQGLVLLCAGLFLFFRPNLFGALLPYLFSFVVLILSAIELQKGLVLRREGSADGAWWLAAGGVLFVFAAVLHSVPFASREANYILIGMGYVLAGLSTFVPRLAGKLQKKVDDETKDQKGKP